MDDTSLTLHSLTTPCLLLDRAKLAKNAARMRDRLPVWASPSGRI